MINMAKMRVRRNSNILPLAADADVAAVIWGCRCDGFAENLDG